MTRFARAILVSLALAGLASADTIYLQDGTRIEGAIKRDGPNWIVTADDGKVSTVPGDQVKRIALSGQRKTSNAGAPVTAGADGLESLRRSAENLSDISQIIDRYNRFITQAQGTPSEAEARKDLEVWQQRQAQGLVKADNRWVTPAEREALRGKAMLTAGQGRELAKQNKFNEAGTVLTQAIAQDPQCVTALYLLGYVQIKQNQIPEARKSLDAAAALLRDHAPTLNNLALVMFRQNQVAQALATYDQAMLAQPSDPTILANVAEALHTLNDLQKNSAQAQKAQQDLAAQQPALDQQMAQKGLHRWGAVYLNDADFARVQAADQEMKAQKDSMQKDFDATQARINQINATIKSNNDLLVTVQNQSLVQSVDGRPVRDSNGRYVQSTLPDQNLAIQQQNTQLANEREQATKHLAELRQQARNMQQKLPIPQYMGIQQPFGVEGTPVGQAGK
jgi:tetratricopeptide (TPR) repeat protein